MMRKIAFCALFIFLFLLECVYAWDTKVTHPLLTRRAITISEINEYLIDNLALSDGVATPLTDGRGLMPSLTNPISVWLEYGAEEEDEPECRASNHFHNPLIEPWYKAGLNDPDIAARLGCSLFYHPYSFANARSNLNWGTGHCG